MKTSCKAVLVFSLFCFFPGGFASALHAMEPGNAPSFVAAGIGIEQLTYREQVPEIALASSDTELTNLALYLEGRRYLPHFFLGARGYIPLSTDEARETWTRGGEFEQANTLTYGWTRIDGYVGFPLHPLLHPYAGVRWSYSEQKRSNFDIVGTPGIIFETSTEEVYALGALFGIEGGIPLTARWSLSCLAEYILPLYSETTNNSLPGWEVTNVDGYSYAFTARLHYAFSLSVTTTLQVSAGRLHWEGDDWVTVAGGSIKWPENDTDFINTFLSIDMHF